MARGDRNYFRHSAATHRDTKIQLMIKELGKEGYFYYFTLLEMCAGDTENSEQTEFNYSLRFIASLWRVQVQSCQRVLTKLQLCGLIVVTFTDDLARLSIPNLPKYMGRYDVTKLKETKLKEKKHTKEKVEKKENLKPLGLRPASHKILELWNQEIKNLPQVKINSALRIKRCEALWEEFPNVEHWVLLFRKINLNKFLTGKTERGWKANFDWVINKNNLSKIIEGNYDEPDKQKNEEQGQKEFEAEVQKILEESRRKKLERDRNDSEARKILR